MGAEQVSYLLAGLVVTLLGLFGWWVRWISGRLDRKDKEAREDRDEFKAMSDRFVEMSETFVKMSNERGDKMYVIADQFSAAAIKFDKTVQNVMENACSSIEEMAKIQMKWREDWDAWEGENREVVKFLTGPFITKVQNEHEVLLSQGEMMKSFTKHVKDEHGLMVENLGLMKNSLEMMNESLGRVCEVLDVRFNGDLEWNGAERRKTGENDAVGNA